MPLDGGEPRKLTDHPLGAGAAGLRSGRRRIAYCAAVPGARPVRHRRDDQAPTRSRRAGSPGSSYRLDGEGFVADKPQQVFVLDLAGQVAGYRTEQPVQLTDEPSGAADPAFTGDGRLVYCRPTGIDELTDEIAVIDVPESSPWPAHPARRHRRTRRPRPAP